MSDTKKGILNRFGKNLDLRQMSVVDTGPVGHSCACSDLPQILLPIAEEWVPALWFFVAELLVLANFSL